VSPRLRLLAWNIRQGGGPERTAPIGLAIVDHAPDLAVLSEFRPPRGGQLRAQLADAGLEHQAVAPAGAGKNTLLIASRWPLVELPLPEVCPGRLLPVDVPHLSLAVLGVHVPDDTSPGEKAAGLSAVAGFARKYREKGALIAGDFNTARRGPDGPGVFRGQAVLGLLETLGFVDAWRRKNPGVREDTWRGPLGQAARLDAAYVSSPLGDAIVDARHDLTVMQNGLSDHAALLVEVEASFPAPSHRTPGGLFDASGGATRPGT
jgi:endonuclease/exonuclease/phosphatase family metal-dependent hydrolase